MIKALELDEVKTGHEILVDEREYGAGINAMRVVETQLDCVTAHDDIDYYPNEDGHYMVINYGNDDEY